MVEHGWQWSCMLSGCAVFLVTVAVYVKTAYPDVTGGDAGELVICGCLNGVAHPPGYPLFTFLAHQAIRALAIVGTPAYRVHLLNAALGGLAAAFTHATAARLTRNVWCGVFAGLGFAFTHTPWNFSIQGEVFALNNALVAAVCLLVVHFFELLSAVPATTAAATVAAETSAVASGASVTANSERPAAIGRVIRVATLGALVCGLCATNQHTTIFVIAPTAITIVWQLGVHGLLTTGRFVALVASTLVGLSPYALMVWRAHHHVIDSWGDQRTVAGFLHHFLRREYGTFQLAASEISEDPGMVSRLSVYARVLMAESRFVPPLLAAVGCYLSLRSVTSPAAVAAVPPGKKAAAAQPQATLAPYLRQRALSAASWLLFTSWFLYVVVWHRLANLDMRPLFLGVQSRFWMQANIYVFIWAGVGLDWFVHAVVGRAFVAAGRAGDQPRKRRALFRRVWRERVFAGTTLAYISVHLILGYRENDMSRNNLFRVLGDHMLQSMPPNAMMIVNGDLNQNIAKYPQQCLGVRPDVRIMPLQLMTWDWFNGIQAENYPGVKFPGWKFHPRVDGAYNFKQFLDANYKRFPILVCGGTKEGDQSWIGKYELVTYGMCARFFKRPKSARKSVAEMLANPPPAGAPPTHQFKNATEMAEYHAGSAAGVPTFEALGGYREFGDHMWEAVVNHDVMTRCVLVASTIAYYASQNSDNKKLVEVVAHFHDRMFEPATRAVFDAKQVWRVDDYRSAGIVFGLYAGVLHERGDAAGEAEYSRKMLKAWALHVEHRGGQSELKPFVEARQNPYSRQPVDDRPPDWTFTTARARRGSGAAPAGPTVHGEL